MGAALGISGIVFACADIEQRPEDLQKSIFLNKIGRNKLKSGSPKATPARSFDSSTIVIVQN